MIRRLLDGAWGILLVGWLCALWQHFPHWASGLFSLTMFQFLIEIGLYTACSE